MPSLTINYVYFVGGSHQRQPRNPSGGFEPIPGLSGGQSTLAPNTKYQPPVGLVKQTETVGNSNYSFAFVSVIGGTNGPQTSFLSNQAPAPAMVGTADIVVLVVYLPVGSGVPQVPPPPTGVSIDAYDETAGMLVDNTFVTVLTDAALTQNANVWGWVDTTSAETLQALTPLTVAEGNANFDKWVILGNSALPPAGVYLKLTQGSSGYALAFYQVPLSWAPCQEELASITRLIKAKKVPVTEVPGIRTQLSTCLSEGGITEQQYKTVIGELNSLG